MFDIYLVIDLTIIYFILVVWLFGDGLVANETGNKCGYTRLPIEQQLKEMFVAEDCEMVNRESLTEEGLVHDAVKVLASKALSIECPVSPVSVSITEGEIAALRKVGRFKNTEKA